MEAFDHGLTIFDRTDREFNDAFECLRDAGFNVADYTYMHSYPTEQNGTKAWDNAFKHFDTRLYVRVLSVRR